MIRIGDVSVARIEESLAVNFEPGVLFPDWRPELLDEHRHWMIPHFFDESAGKFMSSIHTWVVRTPRHVVLVDTCVGNHKSRPAFDRFNALDTPYLARLSAAGIEPNDVDFVFCTHLHVDHVGWNTRLIDGRWVPTFPNAQYVFSKIERDFWDSATGEGRALSVAQNVFEDSIRPILEAQQALVIEGHFQLTDELSIEPAPGHSPGHCILKIDSGGEHGIFSGDVMHQPVQIYAPELNSCFCSDGAAARVSRRNLLEACASSNALLMPAHFGSPHCGRVRERGGRFSFICETV